MADSQFPNGPKPGNPTAQRLGEVLSAWLPGTPEGLYHQYLQTLSPDYDHLLIYSRYDRIWPCLIILRFLFMSSPVFVMDIDDNDRVIDRRDYDGTDPNSMRELESHLSNVDCNSNNRQRCRIISAQHLTSVSMEALGSGLSLDPNVFSHHIGTSFKDIEKSTGIEKLCSTKIEQIPSSVGTFEYEKNLQILKRHLGRLSIANVEHAKDLTARGSMLTSIHHRQGHPMTFSMDVPRTIYVQGYRPEEERTHVIGRRLRARVLALQDRVLSRRISRQRFVDDSMFCDQGERYSQDGLDILQHITIHVINDSLSPECQQILILFPPCPDLDGDNADNDPHVFLKPLATQENIKSFTEFRLNRDRKDKESTTKSTTSRRPQDVEVFAHDILRENEPDTSRGLADIVQLVRSYALDAWFDRLQTLKDQLEDLSFRSLSRRGTPHNEDPQNSDEDNHIVDGLLDEEGMKNAIVRYISSLNGECQWLELDLRTAKIGSSTNDFGSVQVLDEMMEKYVLIRLQMSDLLSETQNLLDIKNSKIQQALTTLQIKESRKFIEQAETMKKYDIKLPRRNEN
ncbi:hypothetical protein N7491_003829 [Penicillium cf. griseofulvum]|uniref:Uncharacterized protein n=1 Tax=Penicillium cf. griseofulvum TaxID=2972120 RepID=A0A9W9MQH5_9EURO|nr:hypothetical protein N7472_001991 [Penicillium cf. griseofulvum]KAJ5441423.1 hypothetical protein N7491_003829 [Penicillium cf. griseofulvum]